MQVQVAANVPEAQSKERRTRQGSETHSLEHAKSDLETEPGQCVPRLAQGRIACQSVRADMDDSDARNIDKVGHRAWCMNPHMTQTGFGTVDRFSAMWSIDRKRKDTPDYDLVACPPPGRSPAISCSSPEE